jgi:hypothetical protein
MRRIRTFGKGPPRSFRWRKAPRLTSARAQRMAITRFAMQGEPTRIKPPITLPKLKFMET